MHIFLDNSSCYLSAADVVPAGDRRAAAACSGVFVIQVLRFCLFKIIKKCCIWGFILSFCVVLLLSSIQGSRRPPVLAAGTAAAAERAEECFSLSSSCGFWIKIN